MPWRSREDDHDFVGNTGLIGLSAVRFRDKGCTGRALLSSWIRLWTNIVLSALSSWHLDFSPTTEENFEETWPAKAYLAR